MHVAPTPPSQGLEAVWPQSREGKWGGRRLGSGSQARGPSGTFIWLQNP